MDNLPLEIIATISDHLEPADFTAFESVNKALRHATEQILACVIFDYDEDDCRWLDVRYDRPRRRACLKYLILYIKLPDVLNDHDNEAEFEYKESKNNKAFTDMMQPLTRILHSWEQGLEKSVNLIIQATAPGIPDDYDQEAWHFHEVPDWMRDPRDVKHFPRRGQSLGFSRGTIQQIPSLGCIKTFTYQGYLLDPEALRLLLRSMPGLTKLRLCMDSRAEQTADSPMKYRDSLARALNATPFSSLGQFDLFCRLGKFSTTVVEKDCMTSPRNSDHLSLALRRISQLPSMENFNLSMEDHALGIEFFSSEPVMGTMGTETENSSWPRLKEFAIRFGSMTLEGQAYYDDIKCSHTGYINEIPSGHLCLLPTNCHLLTPLLTSIFLAMRSMPALQAFNLNIGRRINVQFRPMTHWIYDVPTWGGNLQGERGFLVTQQCFQGLNPPTNPRVKNHAIFVEPAVIDAMADGLRAI